MEPQVLDRPTAVELIAVLQQLPPDMPVRIDDPDTGWTIHQVHVYTEGGTFWLTGEYCEMNGEEGMSPRAPSAPQPPAPPADHP